MAGDDRLSALGDDLLRRVLYFVPAKEAASTSVLSRRWRSLWRSSGAVNLAVRVHEEQMDYCSADSRREADDAFFSRRDAFVQAAVAALAAAASRVTKLTLHVEARRDDAVTKFLRGSRDWVVRHDVVGDVVSHPAARRVEELRVAAVESFDHTYFDGDSEIHRSCLGMYSLASMPSSETLRVLDLTRCGGLAPAAGFPRLATLRLRLCSVDTTDLQALMDAAPELAAVHLQCVSFRVPRVPQIHQFPQHLQHDAAATQDAPVLRLCCTAATALVLALCGVDSDCRERNRGDGWAIEIDAPRLRSFTYKGVKRRFSLTSPAPDLAWVDLHFLEDADGHVVDDPTLVRFWRFVRNFTSAKALRLKVNYLEHVAAVGKASRGELLCGFPNAERLELEGAYDPMSKTAAVAIANLLRCCPVVRDLRLKLSTVPSNSQRIRGGSFLARKDVLDFDRSINSFMRRRLEPAVVSLDDSYYGDDSDEVITDIPGLSGRSFACLQNSLRRVRLQFRLDEANCFGVRLVKFFADNAMVLQYIFVDTSYRRLCEHLNINVEKWIAPNNSSGFALKRKNLEESSWEFSKVPRGSLDSTTHLSESTVGFTVLPLQR